jgi:hypothetical protein
MWFAIMAMAGVRFMAGDIWAASAKAPIPDGKATDAGLSAYPLTLDTSRIRALYMGGDFELAIDELEYARKQGQLLTHADSVFAFKHLGVMYAASYATVEKGKQFMVLLLTIEPSVRILDMYASDMIYMIFRNVQAELEHAGTIRRTSRDPAPGSDSLSAPPPRASGRSRWPYWAAGSVAVAAGVGAILYYAVFDHEPGKPKEIEGGLP